MAQGTSAGVSIPKPILVQQTWGNSISQAIERERARNFEKKMIDQELEYKRSRDTVADAKWNKDFDIRKSQAQTNEELMKSQIVKANKNNQMLQNDLEKQTNDMAEQENYNRIVAQKMQNVTDQANRQELINEKTQQADAWFGGQEATSDLNKQMREAGLKSSWGGAGDAVYDFFDWMGGTDKSETQGLAQAQMEQRPNYMSTHDMMQASLANTGGTMDPQTASLLGGTDFHTVNAVASMPNEQRLMWLKANLPMLLQQNQ